MHDDTIELRQPADDTDALKAYLKPIAIAFGDTYDDAEFEADRPVWEIDRTIGAVEGDTWVGGGGAYSFRLTVPGRREVRAAGITGVGVSPTPSAPRHPHEDDAVAARPGRRTWRAGFDPARVRGRRSTRASGSVWRRSRARSTSRGATSGS